MAGRPSGRLQSGYCAPYFRHALRAVRTTTQALAHHSTAAAALTFTGERFTPEVRGPIWYEHWHRYAVMATLVRGLRVLDAASGEGYGSFLLAHAAASVTGVDVSAAAVAHARERYSRSNLAYAEGSVAHLPLPDASMDLVVSFETIEHLSEQREMLAEFRRVLAPGGALVISSPNRPVYNEAGEVENHFHVKELDRAELKSLLDPVFPQQAWYAQRVIAQSALWAEAFAPAGDAQFVTLPGDDVQTPAAPAAPMYFIVACAAVDASLPSLPALSLFDDGALALWRDYARALGREKVLAWDELDARTIAQNRLTELVVAVNALGSERERADTLAARVAALETALAHARSAYQREAAAHDLTRARLSYRESARGWIRMPFAVLKRRLAGAGR
jgi:2-polyprenyl-3-methyl-5-hydroxy-6-metoxy-1,4-benzoquinol methylase